MRTLELLLGGLRLGLWALMAVAAAQFGRMAAFGWGLLRRELEVTDAPRLPDHPVVTVQLPLRNERYVAERVVRAACALDWPTERLQIQVLDDSDDDTREILDRVAAERRAAGHDVAVLRRPDRWGHKAGNLQHGLGTARGDFVAVFDADCVPPRDFLRRLVPPLLAEPQLGFAQGRWCFDNERAGLLTRVQALVLTGLMVVEQDRLSRLGLPLQFNGSGGVWRRAALAAAGGWLPGASASVTEDMDLAFRARLLGYRGLQVPEVAVRTELPEDMAAFRAQQRRWVLGGAQVLRALGLRTLLGPGRKVMLGHLLRHGRQPLLALFCVAQPLAALGIVPAPGGSAPIAWASLLTILTAAMGLYYGAALRRIQRPAAPAFLLAPVLVALSLGLSLCLTAALLQGLLADRASAEFVRTPKRGAGAGGYRPPRDALAWVETALGAAHLGCAVRLAEQGAWAAALATGGLLAGGLLWVGLGTLRSR